MTLLSRFSLYRRLRGGEWWLDEVTGMWFKFPVDEQVPHWWDRALGDSGEAVPLDAELRLLFGTDNPKTIQALLKVTIP